MKVNKNISVNIKEIDAPNNVLTYYKVTFIEITEKTIFGRTWTKKEEKIVPFVFKSLDIAKDFCEIHPTIVEDVFVNNRDAVMGQHYVKYYTYKLSKDKNVIGYIKWDPTYTLHSKANSNEIFSYGEIPLVGNFVSDIELKSWVNTSTLSNVKFVFEKELLSSLLPISISPKNNIKNEWNFKLVEQ